MPSSRERVDSIRALSRPRLQGGRTALFGGLLLLIGACNEETQALEQLRDQLEEHNELPPGRSAQIHVAAVHELGLGQAPTVTAEARFAVFHGMDRDFARSRVDLSEPVLDTIELGTCTARTSSSVPAGRAGPLAWRDLNLVDVGKVELTLAAQSIGLSYALTPDLVGWMSGLEYRQQSDEFALGALDPREPAPLFVTVDGAPEEDLPPFTLGSDLPAAPDELRLGLVAGDGELLVEWATQHAGPEPVWVQLERQGAVLDCLFPDDGLATVSPEELDAAGLAGLDKPLSVGEELEVRATRFGRSHASAGAFDDIELLVHTQLRARLPVRAVPEPTEG